MLSIVPAPCPRLRYADASTWNIPCNIFESISSSEVRRIGQSPGKRTRYALHQVFSQDIQDLVLLFGKRAIRFVQTFQFFTANPFQVRTKPHDHGIHLRAFHPPEESGIFATDNFFRLNH